MFIIAVMERKKKSGSRKELRMLRKFHMKSISYSVTYKSSFTCTVNAPHSSDISHGNMKQPAGKYNILSDLTHLRGLG